MRQTQHAVLSAYLERPALIRLQKKLNFRITMFLWHASFISSIATSIGFLCGLSGGPQVAGVFSGYFTSSGFLLSVCSTCSGLSGYSTSVLSVFLQA